MKKALRMAALGAALLVGGATLAQAQAGGAQQQGEPAWRPRHRSSNGIELTDAQKVKLDEIQKKYQPEMMSLRNEMMNGGDRAEALMKKASDLREKSAKDIRAILTPDQQVVFDKNLAEQRARARAAPAAGRRRRL